MNAIYTSYRLNFKRPGGTSRGVLTEKETFLLRIEDGNQWGIGECALFRGLSADDRPGYENRLQWACQHIHLGIEALREELIEWPSLVFGLEQAFRSFQSQDPMELFNSDFLRGEGLPINGLVWMGPPEFMQQQIEEKLAEGYRCLKLKIGALEWDSELSLLRALRHRYPADQLEVRVDANGAFSPEEAEQKLQELAAFQLHSIEQPIRAGQPSQLADLCRHSPVPIALDEELIGCFNTESAEELLREIRPAYIVLKPSLIGGYRASETWIRLAKALGIGWWITSALESNIGLNAIAQWTAQLGVTMPQGLGTGALFTNNIDSPLRTDGGRLWYRREHPWNLPQITSICT